MRTLALALVALLIGAASASAAPGDVVVNFDDAAAVPGQSANTIYQGTPGVILGSGVENPVGGAMPTYSSCGTRVETLAVAPSAPRVARITCGGSTEFPDPPVLFGKFTTKTRTRVEVKVGDSNVSGHVMRLSAFDGQGRLLNRSASTAIPAAGTTLVVSAGQPEITYFVLEETGTSARAGVWIDDLIFDTPPVAGQPSFGIGRTAGAGPVALRQGASVDIDISIFRINSSAGNVVFSLADLPTGIDASFSPSVNGRTLSLRAGVTAPLTGTTDPVLIVRGAPADAGTGTVTQKISIPLRISPAITVISSATAPVGLPACAPLKLTYDVAADAGPAAFSVAPLPDGVSATINGVPIASAPPVTGRGTVDLGLDTSKDVTTTVAATVSLTGRSIFDPVAFGTVSYVGRDALDLRPLAPLGGLAPTSGRTPRELQPGTAVKVRGDANCTGDNLRLRFGNDKALAPITSNSGGLMSANVPRLATPGNVQLVTVDGAGAIRPGRADGPRMEIDNYRNTVGFDFRNYTPSLTVDQMVKAYGKDQVYYSPNICGTFSFGLISCKLTTPIPDPWAMIVLEIANLTMGGSSGGACFGISVTSRQLRTGAKSLAGLGRPGATNAFGLGEGPPGGVQELINANHLSQLSAEYLDHYATSAIGNLLTQTASSLRREVEGYLRKGDDPLLSLRDGGTLDRLHVVVGYDVYTDPADIGAYYIDVYDSNQPYLDNPTTPPGSTRALDESTADGVDHEFRHGRSRIHVRNDGSWRMESSNYGARTVDNIIVSGAGNPPAKPTLISASGALKKGFTILYGWAASGLLHAFRADGKGAEETPPGSVTQITSGGRRLYSSPGVINTDPATALRATPWVPSTQAADGEATSEGYLLAAGPGASYKVEVTGTRKAAQTRTVLGQNVVAQLTTDAKPGVTDEFSVVPAADKVGYDPAGSAPAPLNVKMMVRTGDGSTRTAEVDTKTQGADTVSFDPSQGAIVIDHQGPPTTVDLTLSSTPKAGLPVAVKAKVKLAGKTKTTLKPKSWKRLSQGRLTVKSKGRSRTVAVRRARVTGATITGVSITGKGKARAARVKVRVPSSVSAGTANVSYLLRRGRRVIASSSASAGAPGSRTLTWKLPAKARRGDRVVAAITTIVARGATMNSVASRREVAVR
jgi:hypothetical protein